MSTWIIGGLVALAAVLAARSIYKDKKAGKCSCDAALDAAAAAEPVTVIISPMPEQDLPHERRG